jgi:IS5 family transposase
VATIGLGARYDVDVLTAINALNLRLREALRLATIADMVKSPSVYRRLRNFRAGIEAGISCLKRAYGLARCTWKGLPHFEAYVWSSVVAYNLSLLARYRLE